MLTVNIDFFNLNSTMLLQGCQAYFETTGNGFRNFSIGFENNIYVIFILLLDNFYFLS